MKWTKEKADAFNDLLDVFDEVLDRHVQDRKDYEGYHKRMRECLEVIVPKPKEERNLFKQ
tara:strand:- start:37 stop:216 length:180 start_codon:yes stop_codon:yes gene_type:complete